MNISEVRAPRIAPMLPGHAEQVLAIYQAGIDEGDATFETVVPCWDVFDAEKLPEHRLVAVTADGRVAGWVAVIRASSRPPTPASSTTRSTSTPLPAVRASGWPCSLR